MTSANNISYVQSQQFLLLEDFCRFAAWTHENTNYPEDWQMVSGFDALANLLDIYTVKWEIKGGYQAQFLDETEARPYTNAYAIGAELFRKLRVGDL